MRSKLAALALSLVLSLVVAEFALRALGPHVWATPFDSAWSWIEFDPFFGWQNRPHSRHNDFEINELGFRAGPIEVEKPEDTLRILMLGDSGTFGIRRQAPGVASTENYPDELAGLLVERRRRN